MGRILKIASAFIAVVVGAGFASGQEILQFFTSFGLFGTIGSIVATILFGYFGMILMRVGSHLKVTSHRDAIYHLCGRRLGFIVDVFMTVTMFGVGVVMIAGASSIVEQQFAAPPFLGACIMALLIIVTLFLKVEKIVSVIGSVTPFLIIVIVALAIYSIMTRDTPFLQLDQIAQQHESTLPNWFIAAMNYVSFNIAVGAGMAFLIGGAEKDEKKAALGGLIGGLAIGILILFMHFSIFIHIETVMDVPMPFMFMMQQLSHTLSIVMSILLFAMIYSTAVSMFYTFIARFFNMKEQKAIIPMIITVTISFFASFVGFTNLVAKFYPLTGYLGFVLMIVLLYVPFKLSKS